MKYLVPTNQKEENFVTISITKTNLETEEDFFYFKRLKF